jgi:predicted RNase H-like nuclease (RuvC/YqgF family)
MSSEQTERLISEITALRTQCEELRVRNEILEYHIDRERRKCRNLEREVQEIYAERITQSNPSAVLGWGKGKDE